ncbi:MAG: HAMP domain-containing histidine kinase, partial [Acidobacteriota bacterium]|nr:HAMP domain-containing histidine kinase [Acidobacteriota bacterium]
PDQHALLLHRLARTYSKAGRDEAALAAFLELESFNDRIGALPADLIAKYEICSHWAAKAAGDQLGSCAFDLYRKLVGGRWPIEQSRYLFYAASARKWLEGGTIPAEEIAQSTTTEVRKRALTEAVAGWLESAPPARSSQQRRLMRQMDAGTHLAFSSPGAVAESDAVALLVAKTWLAAHAWPDTFARTLAAGFEVTLIGQAGDVLFGPADAAADKAGHTSWMVVRGLQDTTVPWRVRIRPRDPVALSADLARRQTVYLVTLVLVVALLGSGTYLTTRVVKKEMEIARLKSDFVSTVSHEFRSPLTGIRQLGEMLVRGRVPNEDRRQEYYERITRESDRLARLVENVLDFSRMEEGRKEYRFERLDPGPWLRGVVSDCQSLLGDRSTVIVSAIPEDLPSVAADPDALRCAVQNLIDNAVKYSPGRKAVWVDAAAANSHVTIRVRDEGIGISSSDRMRIFEKFYRGGGDSTREVKGAGLGLSLVQHIVLAHGGRIECESRPGEGTTFSMHLKVAPPAPPI